MLVQFRCVEIQASATQPASLGRRSRGQKDQRDPDSPDLIGRLELSGKMTSLDGLHTQHETVHQILYEKGADYSLILRENQPTLLKTAQQLLPTDLPPCTGAQR